MSASPEKFPHPPEIARISQQNKPKGMIESMSDILGSNYQILSQVNADPVIVAKLPYEDLAPKDSVVSNDSEEVMPSQSSQPPKKTSEKSNDDYLFQFYLGSVTVVGLFILFRMIQKSK